MLLDDLDAAAERLTLTVASPPTPPDPSDSDDIRGLLPVRHFADLAAEVDARGPRKWLIQGIWPAGDYGIHGATPKAGKTWNAVDLAVSVTSGTPWLGQYPIETPGPVLHFAGEGGDADLVRRFRAVAHARDLNPDQLAFYPCCRAPHLSSQMHMTALAAWVKQLRPSLVIVDPLYLAARGANSQDLYAMGDVLLPLQEICQDAGASLVVVHHFNRQREAKGADRLTGAGPAEWGRVLLTADVISRHEDKTTRATTVVSEMSVVGGGIPDRTFRLRRRIHADDPDDLDSTLHYETTETTEDEAPDDGPTAGLSPAARKLLEALPDADNPEPVATLVDKIAARYGHGLRRPTCSTELNKLRDQGLADYFESGSKRLWYSTGADT